MTTSRQSTTPPPAPWATCLLASMLLRHAETAHPSTLARLDYHGLLGAGGSLPEIADPRAFLSDPGNWIPYAVLRELIVRLEELTGEKDFAYQAALAYYRHASRQAPTLLETIGLLIQDVNTLLRSAGYWASAYTNYLALQTFTKADEPGSMYLLSHYRPPVSPLLGNIRLVQGNLEGIAGLDNSVEAASCEEQYSQLRLQDLAAEFGSAYRVAATDSSVAIVEQRSGRRIVTARRVRLGTESIPDDAYLLTTSNDDRIVRPTSGYRLEVYSGSHTRKSLRPRDGDQALLVEQGGVLTHGALSYTVHAGALYNAPYSRYRLHWTNKPKPLLGDGSKSANLLRDPAQLGRLLFDHLRNVQQSHRRTLAMVLRNFALTEENVQLKEELAQQREQGGIIGRSEATREVLTLIRTVAASDATVLITGETGTGKELAARLIHQSSGRRNRRFVAVNCAALPETLLESDLFGHERGAFTGAVAAKKGKFELADGGTLFLDEIGDISPTTQVKLLRVLQEKEYQRVGGTIDLKADVRVLAATNRDLETLVEQKQFRSDLYYRLNVIPLSLPPLRDRLEDVADLAEHFIQRAAERAKKPVAGLSPEAMSLCMRYRWPGNIRELENAIERAVALAPPKSRTITPDLLPPIVRRAETPAVPAMSVSDFLQSVEWTTLLHAFKSHGSLAGLLQEIERALTARTVKEYGGNKSAAARALGRTYRWLRKLETAPRNPRMPKPPAL